MSNKYKNIALRILISVNVLEIQFFHFLQTERDRVEKKIKILKKKVVEKRRPRCGMYMCMVVNVLKGSQFVEKTAFHSVQGTKGI